MCLAKTLGERVTRGRRGNEGEFWRENYTGESGWSRWGNGTGDEGGRFFLGGGQIDPGKLTKQTSDGMERQMSRQMSKGKRKDDGNENK